MNKLMLILTRIFLSWWLIPIWWMFLFPMLCLLFGYKYSKKQMTDVTKLLWHGYYDKSENE